MSASGSSLRSRARAWFGRLGRAQKVLAASATLIITVGGVASGITAVLDLGGRISAGGPASNDAPGAALPVAEGVRVTEVIPGSPADRAGLEVGDIITDVGGESVEDVDDLQKALGEVENGGAVRMSVARDSGQESVLVKPGPIKGTRQTVGAKAENRSPDNVDFAYRVGMTAKDVSPKSGGYSPRPEEESGRDNASRAAPPSDGTRARARVSAGEPTSYPAEDAPSADQYSAED